MKRFFLALFICFSACFAEEVRSNISSIRFSVVGDKIINEETQIVTDIMYTPHKSITPIEIMIISDEEYSFSEDQLAQMFEILSKSTYFYDSKDYLDILDLSTSIYTVLSLKCGDSKNKHVIIRKNK